jgi:hypothetical protein
MTCVFLFSPCLDQNMSASVGVIWFILFLFSTLLLDHFSNLSTGVDVIRLFDADFLLVEFLGCL